MTNNLIFIRAVNLANATKVVVLLFFVVCCSCGIWQMLQYTGKIYFKKVKSQTQLIKSPFSLIKLPYSMTKLPQSLIKSSYYSLQVGNTLSGNAAKSTFEHDKPWPDMLKSGTGAVFAKKERQRHF